MTRPRAALFLSWALWLGACSVRPEAVPGDRTLACELSGGTATEMLRSPRYRLAWPIAHRGDRNSGADSSRESILAAARYGVPLIEIDVQLTADGTPVLFHDGALTADNYLGSPALIGRAVNSLSNDEIAGLRLPPRADSTDSPVLFLRDALGLIRPYPSAFELDLKPGSAPLIEAILREAAKTGQVGQLVFQIRSENGLRRMREAHPEAAVAARVFTASDVETVLRYRPEIVMGEEDVLDPRTVERIEAAGSNVTVIAMGPGVDTVDRWETLFRKGVNLIMTDHGNKLMYMLRTRLCGMLRSEEMR